MPPAPVVTPLSPFCWLLLLPRARVPPGRISALPSLLTLLSLLSQGLKAARTHDAQSSTSPPDFSGPLTRPPPRTSTVMSPRFQADISHMKLLSGRCPATLPQAVDSNLGVIALSSLIPQFMAKSCPATCCVSLLQSFLSLLRLRLDLGNDLLAALFASSGPAAIFQNVDGSLHCPARTPGKMAVSISPPHPDSLAKPVVDATVKVPVGGGQRCESAGNGAPWAMRGERPRGGGDPRGVPPPILAPPPLTCLRTCRAP